MRNALKSLFSLRARKNRRQANRVRSRLQPVAAEALEDRALLAAQLISADTISTELQPNEQFDVNVVYTTLDDSGTEVNPHILATLLQMHLHYDSNELTLVGTSNVFTEDNISPPNDNTEASFEADDSDNTTDRAIFSGWFQGFNFDGWPNTPIPNNGRLFTATFQATANFDGTTINFTRGDAANVFQEQEEFTFQSSPLQLTLPATPPAITVGNATAVTEGAQASFNISLDKQSTDTVTVVVSTADDTAEAGSDYTAVSSQTVTFNPGETQKTVTVQTTQETDIENTETFFLNASSPTNATIADAQGIGTINDDDTVTPDLTINNPAAVAEGGVIDFTVSLNEAATQTVTVDFATAADGSPNAATSGSDFTPNSGTLTFNVGETSKTISVQTIDDPNQESAETFAVNLSNISGAVLADASGTGTISDNDSVTPALSIDDVSGDEGTSLTFTVTLSPAANSAVTVNYSTESDNGPNGATAGDDFTAVSNGSLTFNAGETSKTVSITTIDDPDVEGDELFNVLLNNASGATIADGSGQGTIVNNDNALPTVSIANAPAVLEGNDSIFTVTLSESSNDTVTVDFATADGNGPIGAMTPGDYTAATGTLTFNPGETQKTISITTIDDGVPEENEEFAVSLSNASNASIGTANAVGIINDNDDQLPSISIENAEDAFEGTDVVFRVTLSAAASSPVTVNYRTVNGSGPLGATSPADFDEVASGTVTFPANTTEQFIRIPAKLDGTTEGPEGFSVELFNPSGATLNVASGNGSILDPPPTVSVSDATTVVEGSNLTFTFTLNEQVSSPLTVNYTVDGIGNNAATGGADFTPVSGSLTFNPGPVLQQQITVTTIDDNAFEGTEDLAVNITTVEGGVINDGQGLGSIADNDLPVSGGAIEGRKFDDQNGNGVWDSDEPFLNGWTITLLDDNHEVVGTAVTADIDLNNDQSIDPATETGWYRFTADPGTYSIRETLQAGWVQTAPGMTVEQRAYQLDLQYQFQGTVNDFHNWAGENEKWFIDGNGAWYYILPTGSIYLWDAGPTSGLTGTLVDTLDESYWANPVLVHSAPPVPFPSLTLTDGSVLTVDFGNVTQNRDGMIQGQKWNDLNQNGIQDPGEPGLDGWTIELLSTAGNVIATTTTASIDLNNNQTIEPNEVGVYQFTVVPGSYRVREVQQSGWVETTQVNPADVAAFDLDQSVNLSRGPSLFENWGGLGEKWLQSANAEWYFITPNGDVFQWDGSPRTALTGTHVASTSAEHYANPALLYDATNPYEQRVSVNPAQTITGVNFANWEEPVPPPEYAGNGNVNIIVAGNTLILNGDSGHNGVFVYQNGNGHVSIRGLGQTRINGSANPWVSPGWTSIGGSLITYLFGGDDAIVFENINVGLNMLTDAGLGNNSIVGRNSNIGTGFDAYSHAGNAKVLLDNVNVGSIANIITSGGHDSVIVRNSNINGPLVALTGTGDDLFAASGTTVGGYLYSDTSLGNDLIGIVDDSSVSGATTLVGSSGTDLADLGNSNFGSNPTLIGIEGNSIPNLNQLIDDMMTGLALAGLGPGLATP